MINMPCPVPVTLLPADVALHITAIKLTPPHLINSALLQWGRHQAAQQQPKFAVLLMLHCTSLQSTAHTTTPAFLLSCCSGGGTKQRSST
jgi:hypothetical protein